MTSVALYTLAGQYQKLAEQLAELDLDAQTVADTIEASGLTDEIAAKAQGIEMVARCMEMHTPAIDMEIERLQKLKKQRQALARGLRDYLLSNMQAMGVQKIEAPLFRLSVRENPAAVEIYQPELIPGVYMVTPEPPPAAPDKKAISAALKAGHDVPGCRLSRGTRLEIR